MKVKWFFLPLSIVLGIQFSAKAGPPEEICTLQGASWMPLRIWIDMEDFTDPGTFGWTEDETRNLFLEASRIWTRESGAKFNFEFVDSPGSNVMVINTANLASNVWAETELIIVGTACHPIRVTLNTDYSLVLPTFSSEHVVEIWGDKVIHELGHAIGLGHPTDDRPYDTVMYKYGYMTSLTWNDITVVRDMYGIRHQQVRHWLYPWSGAWADLGYVPGAYSNLGPSVAEVPNDPKICVVYGNDEYWTYILVKKGIGSTWTDHHTNSYTNTGVALAYGGGKYLFVFVNEINEIYGEKYHYLYYQTSTNCESWTSPVKLPRESCMGWNPQSAMKPAIEWSQPLGEFMVVGSTWGEYGLYSNKLHLYYFNPATNSWRYPLDDISKCHLKDDQGRVISAVGGTSLTCSNYSRGCYLVWRDDAGVNEGNLRGATIGHTYNPATGKYDPYLTYFKNYSYSSGHGVGDGTYFPQDPYGMGTNFFKISEGDTDVGYLYFVKTNGIYEMTMNVGSSLWDAVGSCRSGWWNMLFAVGCDAAFDYP